MTTQIRTTLLTAIIFFCLLISAKAQNNYEYAVISFKPASAELILCQNGTEFKKIEVSKDEIKNSYFDTNPALKQINKMSTEGWELFNTETLFAGSGVAYIYFLKRK